MSGLDAYALEVQQKLLGQVRIRENTEALLRVIEEMLEAYNALELLKYRWERATDRAERMAMNVDRVDAAMVGRSITMNQCLYDLEKALSPLVSARKKYDAVLDTLRQVQEKN